MDRDIRLKRLRFRAWHRGTREADMLIGGFFDAHAAGWDESAIAAFEALMDEEDVEIMGWAIGTIAVPERWQGPLIERMRVLDYITVAKTSPSTPLAPSEGETAAPTSLYLARDERRGA